MVIVRVLILLFLVFFGYGMGSESKLNAFGTVVAASFFISAPLLYFLPTFEAWKNKATNLQSVFLLNLFLGWTIFGWVASIVWAFKKPEVVSVTPTAVSAQPLPTSETLKKCPFCAEMVLAAAIKCKHCGSVLN